MTLNAFEATWQPVQAHLCGNSFESRLLCACATLGQAPHTRHNRGKVRVLTLGAYTEAVEHTKLLLLGEGHRTGCEVRDFQPPGIPRI